MVPYARYFKAAFGVLYFIQRLNKPEHPVCCSRSGDYIWSDRQNRTVQQLLKNDPKCAFGSFWGNRHGG